MRMTAHEVLVRARNGAALESYDIHSFGVWQDQDCGTTRCMLGWCAWESGIRLGNGESAAPLRELEADTPDVYKAAVLALWKTRPCEPDLASAEEPLFAVEDVAHILHEEAENAEAERAAVTAWFDRAIAITTSGAAVRRKELALA